MKFKRAELIKPGKFEIREVEEKCGAEDIVVKIASCGLCNWEINFWKGTLNFTGYPHKLGHEYAGTVAEVGSKVKTFQIGDKVSCFARGFGGFAEYKILPAAKCQKLADEIDPKYALGEPQKCVLTVMRLSRAEAGDYGVVLGCGPMGMWCIQGFKGNLLGALIAIDIDDKKLKMAKRYGATHVINSKKEDVKARIAEITKGRMADFVIEGTGIPALLNEAQDYLKQGKGRLVLMSSHEDIAKEFDFRKAIGKSLDIIAAHPDHSENEEDDFRRAVNYINSGTFTVKDMITHEFKLEEINEAFETLENKPKGYMKGIIVCE